MDHLNADQRKMAPAMVYPEAKHGRDASAPAVDLPIADVVAMTIDHRAADAGPVLPKLVTSSGVDNGPRRIAPADFLMGTGQRTSARVACRASG